MIERTSSQFGTQLRQFRESAALTQEELAERAGLSLRGVSDLERGLRTTPRLETVRMLADGLGLDGHGRAALIAARNRTTRSEHVPLRARTTKLPTQPTSFIGRHHEIETILSLLFNDDVRMLTLTGPGGVGKTRLALEAARRLMEDSGQEVAVVDLTTVRRPEVVLVAIASQLGMHDSAEANSRELLQIVLQGRSLVIVLDNVEHVVAAAPDIAWLLTTCPQISILATSRVILRIAAEHVMEVEPFALPPHHDVDKLVVNDAVSLFAVRAHAADARFALTPGNAAIVAEIVSSLQGLPLAIELAAARTRLWPLAELRNQLTSPLLTLTTGANDAPPRHRTMRNAIAWSYDLLAPREQDVMRCLSIFCGGCAQQTALDLLRHRGRYEETQVLDAIAGLVDSSLLRVSEGPLDQVRYSMLQTVREYALEQLALVGDEEELRMAAHYVWCLPLASQVEFVNARPDTVYWLQILEIEWTNLRDHVSWLIAHDRVVEALDVSGSLASYRSVLGFLDEARAEMARLIADERNQAANRVRVRALIGMGNMLFHADDTVSALEYIGAGAQLARELKEYRYLFFSLGCLCVINVFLGRLDVGEALIDEAEEVVRAHDLADQRPIVNLMRVHIAEQRGDWDKAYVLLCEGVRGAYEHRLGFWEAVARLSLGYHLIRRGELDEAESSMLVSLELARDVRENIEICGAYIGLAEIARLRNDQEGTRVMLECALESSRRVGSLRSMAGSLLALARASLAAGQPLLARSQVLEAMTWYQRCHYQVFAVTCLDVCADVAIEMNLPERAAWCIGAVDGVLETTGQSRVELSPGEHRRRLERTHALMHMDDWQQHYDRGRSMSIEEVLAAVASWSEAAITLVHMDPGTDVLRQ